MRLLSAAAPGAPRPRRRRPVSACAVVVLLVGSLGLGGGCAGAGALRGPGAVASASRIASRVGAEVLARGGNAVDAAVATAFALAVTHPAAGNVGGGGFLVLRAPDGQVAAFDFRETAPARATRDMFLDAEGNYDREKHHWSALAVGVPGTVSGLHLAHERFGRVPWGELLEPAIALAAGGFEVSAALSRSLAEVLPAMERYPASRAQFTRDGKPYEAGDILVQADLARTLERIRDAGPRGFYEGETADLIVAEMERTGGIVSHADLREYRAVEREPLQGYYRGARLITMPPPSSGGVALLTMLGVLEAFPLERMEEADRVHLVVEAMRRAFADRARYLADPDQIAVPVPWLISPEHAASLRRSINPARATPSEPDSFEWYPEGDATTHLSVLDNEGLAVSLTTTLEQSYGSRIVVPGAGFLLNNEMGDFNPQAGLTTERGLIGTAPNLTAPRKRMLSSMSPTIVVGPGDRLLVLGSPGGRTIINTVLEVILRVVDLGMSLDDAVAAPRFHHQWLPDEIVAEEGAFSPEVRAELERRGHQVVEQQGTQGAVMALRWLAASDGMVLEIGVDPRHDDAGAALVPERTSDEPQAVLSSR